jgi:hypothetical protein
MEHILNYKISERWFLWQEKSITNIKKLEEGTIPVESGILWKNKTYKVFRILILYKY